MVPLSSLKNNREVVEFIQPATALSRQRQRKTGSLSSVALASRGKQKWQFRKDSSVTDKTKLKA